VNWDGSDDKMKLVCFNCLREIA